MSVTFSIIVPVYNIENYLDECLCSLIGQTYRDIEIILVDDGSLDGSGRICDRFKEIDSRIMVIHKKNGGLVSARKAGALVANGDYITPIDGDDWVDLEYISSFAEIANNYNPDIICGGYIRETLSGSIKKDFNSQLGLYNYRDIEEKVYPKLIQPSDSTSLMLTVWGKAFKRELYVESQMTVDNNIKLGEDIACVVPCMLSAKSMVVAETCYYHYRILQDSMSRNRCGFSWDVPKRLYDQLSMVTEKHGLFFDQQVAQRIVRETFFVATSQFLGDGSYFQIRNNIKKELDSEYIKESIQRSRFKPFRTKEGTIYWIYQTMLKYRLFLLMKLYIKTR